MGNKTAPLLERPAWRVLEAHFQQVRKLHLRDLFAGDPTRGERMTIDAVVFRCHGDQSRRSRNMNHPSSR